MTQKVILQRTWNHQYPKSRTSMDILSKMFPSHLKTSFYPIRWIIHLRCKCYVIYRSSACQFPAADNQVCWWAEISAAGKRNWQHLSYNYRGNVWWQTWAYRKEMETISTYRSGLTPNSILYGWPRFQLGTSYIQTEADLHSVNHVPSITNGQVPFTHSFLGFIIGPDCSQGHTIESIKSWPSSTINSCKNAFDVMFAIF